MLKKKSKGGSALDLGIGLLYYIIEVISSVFESFGNVLYENFIQFLYYILFLGAYVLCFFYLQFNTTQIPCIALLILLHCIFLFMMLVIKVKLPIFEQNQMWSFGSFSIYMVSIGWIFILVALAFLLKTYMFLYYKFIPNGVDIQFGTSEPERKMLIKTIMYLSFIIMFGLAAMAQPLFYVLFGEKWLPSVPIFQALCLAYSITPMHIINQNVLKVKGRSDLFLKTEMIKYFLFTPLLILGIIYGLKVLVAGIALFYWMGFFINALYTKKLIDYSIFAQCKDFFLLIFHFGIPALLVLGLGFILNMSAFPLLMIQTFVYVFVTVGISFLFKVSAFFEILEILKNKITVINMVKTLKNN